LRSEFGGRKMNANLVWSAIILSAISLSIADATRTIEFGGIIWDVKSGIGGPNPNEIMQNSWSDSTKSVWVDNDGRLHLRIEYENGLWKCAEIQSVDLVKYGKYTWELNSKIDNLDPNVVLGLFLYSDECNNEYDIEFSKWGDENSVNNTFYSCWGPGMDIPVKKAFRTDLSGEYTTHIMKWYEGGISFTSYYGHGNGSIIESWQPDEYPVTTPKNDMRLHMNLWLTSEKHPRNPDTRDIEVIIDQFNVINN
jgi:hypothetical protein